MWSHLLKKTLMENVIFCAVLVDRKIKYNWDHLDEHQVLKLGPPSLSSVQLRK